MTLPYRLRDGVHTFSAGKRLSVSVARTQEGNCVQIRDGCVQLIPKSICLLNDRLQRSENLLAYNLCVPCRYMEHLNRTMPHFLPA